MLPFTLFGLLAAALGAAQERGTTNTPPVNLSTGQQVVTVVLRDHPQGCGEPGWEVAMKLLLETDSAGKVRQMISSRTSPAGSRKMAGVGTLPLPGCPLSVVWAGEKQWRFVDGKERLFNGGILASPWEPRPGIVKKVCPCPFGKPGQMAALYVLRFDIFEKLSSRVKILLFGIVIGDFLWDEERSSRGFGTLELYVSSNGDHARGITSWEGSSDTDWLDAPSEGDRSQRQVRGHSGTETEITWEKQGERQKAPKELTR
jgi:hypothetical protein